ncbi:type III-B CRISPR module RAMP protein Cmr1, partial [Methanospirillum hungatei]|uniref:type III-B CRISPR module RAMP protein Cmr1 n=1 Tax=Methanospirillum hungatei TaxID=2203 RepID=UPI0026EE9E21
MEPDDAVVVRGTSVRGHLRFWWRATHGSFIDSPEALFEKEGEIWGTTKKSSEVIITLEIESCKREKCETSDGKFFGGYPPYALFPFKSNRKGSAIRDIVIELSFQLHIRCPKKL